MPETSISQSSSVLSVENTLAQNALPYCCPLCHQLLNPLQGHYTCTACDKQFPIRMVTTQEGLKVQPDFRMIPATTTDSMALKQDETEGFQNRLKHWLRQSPGFYRFLVYTIGPALLLGPTSQQFVRQLTKANPDARFLSVGAGVLRLKGNVVHLDYEPYPHLEVTGDAHHLPFADNVFDGVICESLLEHVLEPQQVIWEIYRVLKPGGQAFMMMPFMFNFHAAPNDYYRFTHRGFLHQMKAFIPLKLQVVAGPTSALTCVLVEWLAMVFSLGSRRLYRLLSLIFLVLLAPLKVLDFVLTFHPEAVRIASVLLLIGQKPSKQPSGH